MKSVHVTKLNIVPTIPDNELAICHRVRELRLFLKRKQSDFAKEIDVTRVRLASYEYGRAPLKYGVAKKICKQFDVNQRWLATGKLPQFHYIEIDTELDATLSENANFSEVYASQLRNLVDTKSALLEAAERGGLKLDFEQGPPLSEQLRKWCLSVVGSTFERLPADLYREFYEFIFATTGDFLKKHDKKISAHYRKLKKQGFKKS